MAETEGHERTATAAAREVRPGRTGQETSPPQRQPGLQEREEERRQQRQQHPVLVAQQQQRPAAPMAKDDATAIEGTAAAASAPCAPPRTRRDGDFGVWAAAACTPPRPRLAPGKGSSKPLDKKGASDAACRADGGFPIGRGRSPAAQVAAPAAEDAAAASSDVTSSHPTRHEPVGSLPSTARGGGGGGGAEAEEGRRTSGPGRRASRALATAVATSAALVWCRQEHRAELGPWP